MINATIASIEKVSADGIVVKLADGETRELKNGDPMLKRMDLAYAINTHMAQGITNENVFSVMGARETNLRSEEHTSELQSLMRIPYAVFALNKKTDTKAKSV